jgi:hypothetical protein
MLGMEDGLSQSPNKCHGKYKLDNKGEFPGPRRDTAANACLAAPHGHNAEPRHFA